MDDESAGSSDSDAVEQAEHVAAPDSEFAKSDRQLRQRKSSEVVFDDVQAEGGSQQEGVLEHEDDSIDWEAAMPNL